MAKPILIIRIPFHTGMAFIDETRLRIKNHPISTDYHVLVIGTTEMNPTFECFNDSKGLTDIDIEKLINELIEKNEPDITT